MAAIENRIVVLGLGGGGGKIVARMAEENQTSDNRVTLAVADADHGALERVTGVIQIPLAKGWPATDGCGANSTKGEKAAAASSDDLRQLIEGASFVIVIAGFGRGTGAGAARVLARHLRELGILHLFVVTLPFSFEGHWPCHQAAKDLEILRGLCDTAIAIPNDLLFADLPANTPAAQAFEACNRILAKCSWGLTRLPQTNAILPVKVADLRNLLREKPEICTLGTGHGTGAERWQEAVRQFFACPLVGGPENLARTDAAVLTLIGGEGLSLGEIQACMTSLQKQFPPTARILVGAYADPVMQDTVLLTGLICRFAGEAKLPLEANPISTRRPKTKEQQGELPLQEQALGIFAGSSPTTVDGENLDIPTFQRRSIYLDTGM